MNVRPYKLAPNGVVRWIGTRKEYLASPLPRSAIEAANEAARVRFEAAGAECQGVQYELEVAMQILSRAMNWPVEDMRRDLRPFEVDAFYTQWDEIQSRATPNIARLQTWLRKRINDDPGIINDGVAAYRSTDPGTYYGLPVIQLTDGQLAYWVLVREAYAEFNVPDEMGRVKEASRKWLKRED